MSPRRFPTPWREEKIAGGYVVRDYLIELGKQALAAVTTNVAAGAITNALRHEVVDLLARPRLPALYSEFFLREDWRAWRLTRLIAVDMLRRSASYVDRILRGDKPGDLPFQQPTKIRVRPQSENRTNARPHRATDITRVGRRGN